MNRWWLWSLSGVSEWLLDWPVRMSPHAIPMWRVPLVVISKIWTFVAEYHQWWQKGNVFNGVCMSVNTITLENVDVGRWYFVHAYIFIIPMLGFKVTLINKGRWPCLTAEGWPQFHCIMIWWLGFPLICMMLHFIYSRQWSPDPRTL